MVASGMALEHARGLRLLIRAACYISALGMLRLQYEALTRAVWLLYAATNEQVETLAAPLTREAERQAKKLPMFSQMLDEIVEKAPPQASLTLMNFKNVNYHAMISFVHSGIHPLRRHSDGYPPGLIEGVIRNSNGLNVVTFQIGVMLIGDLRFSGAVSAIQKKHHQILPA